MNRKIFFLIFIMFVFCFFGCNNSTQSKEEKQYYTYNNPFNLQRRHMISSGEYVHDISTDGGDFSYFICTVGPKEGATRYGSVHIRILSVGKELDYTTLEKMDITEDMYVNPMTVEVKMWLTNEKTFVNLQYDGSNGTYSSAYHDYDRISISVEKIKDVKPYTYILIQSKY